MSESNIKAKASKGIVWNTIDKFGTQSVQFIVGIVLARLLTPEDFGLIAMLTIFLSISQLLIESGLGVGLIQKQDRTQDDFSSVFVFNILVSLALYLLLFLGAPLIAAFYEVPQLTSIVRIIGLNIIVNSFSLVPLTRLAIKVNFKTSALINNLAIVMAGLISIYLAHTNFGVWALVYFYLSRSLIASILLSLIDIKSLSIKFSKKSIKSLFGFSSKLIIANLYSQILNNLYNVLIGKVFTIASLGNYNRAKSLTEVSAGTISNVINQVTFPILSSFQKEREKMITLFRKTLRMTAFVIFPSMVLLSILSEPIVLLLLTEKWSLTIPLLQWMAFTRFFYPINALNMTILNAVGRSDLFLKIDLVKFPIVVIPMIIAAFISVKAMVVSQVIASFLSFFINAYLPGKLYNYGPRQQLKDIGRIFISTCGMGLISILVFQITDNQMLRLLLVLPSALLSYMLFSYILNVDEIRELAQLIKTIKKRN